MCLFPAFNRARRPEFNFDDIPNVKVEPDMLKRAGELFAILTCGSFKTLQLEFDDHDNMQFAGIRQDGRRVD